MTLFYLYLVRYAFVRRAIGARGRRRRKRRWRGARVVDIIIVQDIEFLQAEAERDEYRDEGRHSQDGGEEGRVRVRRPLYNVQHGTTWYWLNIINRAFDREGEVFVARYRFFQHVHFIPIVGVGKERRTLIGPW